MIEVTTDLKRRIDELVPRLARLSEAASHKIGRDPGKRKPQSAPPPGVRFDRAPPDPDDSLLLYFVWKLDKARSQTAVKAAVAEVEIRLLRRLKRPSSAEIVAGSATEWVAVKDRIEERDRRIAEDYVGLEPAEVAAIESEIGSYCPPSNVRRVRLFFRRDPELGEPLEDETERTYALALRSQGLSVNSIAMRVGRPKTTVTRWLKPTRPNGKAA